MKRYRWGLSPLVTILLAMGCAGPGVKGPEPAAGPEANLEVAVYEVVENPEAEGTAYAKVFVDGQPLGDTASGPKSKEKSWAGHVEAGNRLLKIEYWTMEGMGSWTRLPDDLQPRERFVRVGPAGKVKVSVKFYDKARRNASTVAK